jgi:3',5'-cyclic AMP phosphodiesterase CpdA
MNKLKLSLTVLILFAAIAGLAQEIRLPNEQDSLHFAVIGDSGTGGRQEYEVADKLAASRQKFPFEFVVMMGDNLYGSESPRDFENKFEKPYRALLAANVKFYASLGNHDDPARQISYKHFNMGGKKYYTFRPKLGVRFFALDSNYMDKAQLEWLDNELKASGSEWKIVFFHHPIYSSGEKHGSNVELRSVLEPVLVKYGVDVVLAGHEHFYERIKPQKGINYFIVGSSAKLRSDNIGKTELTVKGFDEDNVFMLAEIKGDQMFFQVITRSGKTIDFGDVRRAERKPASTESGQIKEPAPKAAPAKARPEASKARK